MKHLLICLVIIFASLQSFAISAITGTLNVCTGSTTTLSDATSGGVWSSHSPVIATVGSSTGIVTGVSAGTVTITYNTGIDSVVATVTVNPTPSLLVTSNTSICDSVVFAYTPASSVTGTAFSWSRGFVLGIGNPPAAGTGSISEALINNTNNRLVVTYVYTLTAGSCMNTQHVSVTVNPTPKLSSLLSPPDICDSGIFNYTPMSNVVGTIFTWYRPAITGIAESASTGTGNPNEMLIDTSVNPIAAIYTFTMTANSCSYVQPVTVTVNPYPKLSSPLTMPTICDSQFVKYTPASLSPGVTFLWSRPGQTGITPGGGMGAGNINELLFDTVNAPVTVTYYYSIAINGCVNIFPDAVTIVIDTCHTSSVANINPVAPINIFPNPTNNTVTISGLENIDGIELLNTVGSVFFSQKENVPATLEICLSAFPAGMYYIIATGKHGYITGKIIKQ